MTLKTRFILTISILSLWLAVFASYSILESPIKGHISANQLDDTTESYAANKIASTDIVSSVIAIVATLGVITLWYGPVFGSNKK